MDLITNKNLYLRMNCKHLHVLIAILAVGMLASCHSDIDLQNVDKKAELQMGLALPIGSIHATLIDFVGGGKVDNLYVENGMLTWRDTFPDGRRYHTINLADSISTDDFPLNVYEKLDEKGLIYGGNVIGDGNPITLDFEMPIKLKGINNALGNERLDSAYITEASFFSTLKTTDFSLEWEWIDRVTLDLGDQVSRPAGNQMTVYERPTGTVPDLYNTAIPTDIDNFTLCMMKDPTKDPGVGNYVNQATFIAHMTFTIPSGTSVPIANSSKLNYELAVKFIKYSAVWGYFKPSSDMFVEVKTPIGERMGSLSFLQSGNYPFSDPHIKVDIETYIAGDMRIDSCYVFSQDKAGNRVYADFNGKQIYRDVKLYGDFLDPHKSPIGDSTLLWTEFNKDPDKGHIDRLFGKIPDSLGYKFKVDFDIQRSPQVRMLPEPYDSIKINAICTLPMQFNKGLYIEYNDTLNDVKLSQYSLDSMMAGSNVIDSIKSTDITLFMTAYNDIHATIRGVMRCYDKDGKMVMDPADKAKPFLLFPQDTLLFDAPKFELKSNTWGMSAPGQNVLTAKLNKQQVDVLPSIKRIIFKGVIDDRSLQYTFDKGENKVVKFTDDQGLNIQLGLTTQADVILNLGKTENKK